MTSIATLINPGYEIIINSQRPQINVSSLQYFLQVYQTIHEAKIFYPKFDGWYFQKVLPGFFSGERKLIVETRGNDIAGVAIIKKSGERKLCTLQVVEEYRNRGIGIKLFKKVFEELETEKPFFTVSEEKHEDFRKIFDYFDFRITSKKRGMYRSNKYEYFYNEFSK